MTIRAIALLLPVLVLATGCAGLKDVDLSDLLQAPLDEETVAAGLREALTVGTERAVGTVSGPDGFLGDASIRIALPEDLRGTAGALRDIGLGDRVDGFVTLMNRAAEEASALALQPFADAARAMTIADAFAILEGDDDAATAYFRGATEDALRARFRPVVSGAMDQTGLYADYERYFDLYERLPFTDKPELDLTDYITDRTLDGLFLTLAEEEGRIRHDPLARTTALLQRVFDRR